MLSAQHSSCSEPSGVEDYLLVEANQSSGERNQSPGAAANVNDLNLSDSTSPVQNVNFEENEVYKKSTFASVSLNVALLFWPIYIHHKNLQGDSESCEGCILTPISPAANSRDVCDCRLYDPIDYSKLDGTMCHVLVGHRMQSKAITSTEGGISTTEHGSPTEEGSQLSQLLSFHSVFDRYSNKSEVGTLGVFNIIIDIDDMKQKASEIMKVFEKSTRKLKDCNTPDDIMIFLQKRIAKKYKNLAVASNYYDFFEALNSKYADVITRAPCCIKTASIALQTTYVLQQVFPYCIAFLNGNHRHSRQLFKLFNCKRHENADDIINDESLDGYIIQKNSVVDIPMDECIGKCDIYYQYYHLRQVINMDGLKLEDLQSISNLCNQTMKNSLEEECCHKILFKCNEVITKVTKAILSESHDLGNYNITVRNFLAATMSDKKNASRDKESSSYYLLLSIKTSLRIILYDEFYGSYGSDNVNHAFTSGFTYYERLKKSKSSTVIFNDGNNPIQGTIAYELFLLLDNIINPREYSSFLAIIRDSYKGDHVRSSYSHNICHTKMWDSCLVLKSMNEFIYNTMTMMKNPKVIKEALSSVADVFPNDDVFPPTIDKYCNLLLWKLRRCSSDYAMFIAMYVVKKIGLYPIIGQSWKLDMCSTNQQHLHIGTFNIFSMLNYLLSTTMRSTNVEEHIKEDSVYVDNDINIRTLNEEDTSSETGTEEEDISAADQCSAISDASITMGTTSETNIPAASAVTPDKRKTPITPRILFIKYVIHGMVLRMAFEHISGEILFPISFEEFISQKCHEDFLLFYQELTNLFEDAINDFFHPLVSPDQNIWKRKKKRKLNDERGGKKGKR
jgi:hypothetical protein